MTDTPPKPPGNRREKMPRGIECDQCGGFRWMLVDVAPLCNGSIRRRRECKTCGNRINTAERRVVSQP